MRATASKRSRIADLVRRVFQNIVRLGSHDIEKHRFAGTVARAPDSLQSHAEQVVIVPPPRTLANLRRSFSPAVDQHIPSYLEVT